MDCNEIFLSDIVKVDVYKASDVTLPIPWSVPGVNQMSLTVADTVTPLLTMSLSGEVEISSSATLKITRSRTASGFTYQHTITATVTANLPMVSKAIQDAGTADLLYICTHADGSRTLHVPCPGASQMDMTENHSTGKHEGELTLTLKSKSAAISIQE